MVLQVIKVNLDPNEILVNVQCKVIMVMIEPRERQVEKAILDLKER